MNLSIGWMLKCMGMYGSVLRICQGYVTRWLKVVAMGDL
jgi:hypothetical protein